MNYNLADARRTTFQAALDATAGQQRHVLLGNGFSIAASDRFNYSSLMAAALNGNEPLGTLFSRLMARDFEHAMEQAADPEAVEFIRSEFVAAVLKVHPVRSVILPKWRMEYCAEFLAHFVGRDDKAFNGRVFTTNYDLLTCWMAAQHKELSLYDGFHGVKWNEGSVGRSRIYYLHGALHIYEDLTQREWEQTNKQTSNEGKQLRLIEVVRESVRKGMFPLIVSEGSHTNKLAKIGKSKYLIEALRCFSLACENEKAALFVLGHKLGDVDMHIRHEIAKGNVRDVYIGVFNSDDESNAFELSERWQRYRRRLGQPDVQVRVYRSQAVALWGPAAILE